VTELAIGSSPRVKDTDGGGLADGVENADKNRVVDATDASPKAEDADQDGIEDGVEAAPSYATGVAAQMGPTFGDVAATATGWRTGRPTAMGARTPARATR